MTQQEIDMAREQQKIHLTPEARQRLRDEAKARGMEMSEIVERLLLDGEYPESEAEKRGMTEK